MKLEEIEAFCRVVDTGSITKASDALYISQSAVSKRIKSLEEELGIPLIVRKSGLRKIELTSQGEEFLVLARQWQSLLKEFKGISDTSQIHEISIGSIDMFNCFSLRGLYNQILKKHKDIRLDIHTRHSREIYAMMEAQQLDIGLVNLLLPAKRLEITALFSEPMYIVRYPEKEYKEKISARELDPEKEIYSRWSGEFEIWHDQHWPGKRYRMHVGTSSTIPYYVTELGQWAICPESSAKGITSMFDLEMVTLSEPMPNRTFYLLEHTRPRESRVHTIERFKQLLLTYINDFDKMDRLK